MKMWKKLLTSVLAAVMLFCLLAGSVLAAEPVTTKQPYSYTVTFYAGNQGSFKADEGLTVSNDDVSITQTEDKIIVSGLKAGDEVGLTAQAAVALDTTSKYYVKGLRLSGRDNDTVAASAFVVDGDADYVVAYGIKGNQVSYTVSYHDTNGNELAPNETFYGNIGDKPVIAYKYIAEYAPQALGLTKTLSENAAGNVFTFVYEVMPTPTINEVVTDVVTEVITEEVVDAVVVVGGGSTGTGGVGTGGAGSEDGEGSDGAGISDETGDGGEGTGEGTGGDGTGSGTGEDGSEGGEDGDSGDIILDLDDEEPPLAFSDSEVDQDGVIQGFPTTIYVGVIMVAIATLMAFALVSFAMKKREK